MFWCQVGGPRTEGGGRLLMGLSRRELVRTLPAGTNVYRALRCAVQAEGMLLELSSVRVRSCHGSSAVLTSGMVALVLRLCNAVLTSGMVMVL